MGMSSHFIGFKPADDRPGMEVKLGDAVVPWRDGEREGFEVDIKKLPKDVTILRFYNCW